MPVTCHLCGRDFGRRSLGIHLAACRRRLEAEDRTEPEQPRLLASILRWTLELATNLRDVFTITEKALTTRAFPWLKAPTSN